VGDFPARSARTEKETARRLLGDATWF